MLCLRLALLALLLIAPGSFASAQLLAETLQSSSSEATTQTVRFRVGVIVTAKRGACRDILATVAVPIECEEQTVRLVEEDLSQGARYEFRDLSSGIARQMVVFFPYLANGAEGRALLTFEVTTRTTLPPDDAITQELRIPKRPPRNLRGYLGASPFIELRHPKIKKLARSIQSDVEESAGDAEPSDWSRLEAIYDYVMDNIEYLEGPDTSAVDTLKAGEADCHGRSALFIALCRATKTPARLVWVNEHVYPEFYLERPDGEGVWLPAESAGTRDFGGMPLARPILQKGDSFRVPERPREKLRYAIDYLQAYPAKKGNGPPGRKFVREVVAGG